MGIRGRTQSSELKREWTTYNIIRVLFRVSDRLRSRNVFRVSDRLRSRNVSPGSRLCKRGYGHGCQRKAASCVFASAYGDAHGCDEAQPDVCAGDMCTGTNMGAAGFC
eukprot:9269991-Pyramimonas_sp.AAC.2